VEDVVDSGVPRSSGSPRTLSSRPGTPAASDNCLSIRFMGGEENAGPAGCRYAAGIRAGGGRLMPHVFAHESFRQARAENCSVEIRPASGPKETIRTNPPRVGRRRKKTAIDGHGKPLT